MKKPRETGAFLSVVKKVKKTVDRMARMVYIILNKEDAMRNIFMSVVVLFYMSAGLFAQDSYSGTREEFQVELQSSAQSIANGSKAAILIAGTIAPFVASVVTYEATRDVGLALVAVGAGVIFDMAAYQGIMIGYELSKLEESVPDAESDAKASN